MKKNDLHVLYSKQSASVFTLAAIGLTVSSALVFLTSAVSDMNTVASVIFQFFSVAFMIFAYVMTVKGFSFVNKECRLDEKNEYYYFGKNMMIFSVLSVVLSVIFEIIAFVLYVMLSVYKDADSLSAADTAAASNIKVLASVVVIAVQLVSIAMPYIFYMWHIHKTGKKDNRLTSLSLVTMLLMVVQSAIVILNAVYSMRGAETGFLSSFAEILKVIEYLMLTVFFIYQKKSLAPTAELKIEE